MVMATVVRPSRGRGPAIADPTGFQAVDLTTTGWYSVEVVTQPSSIANDRAQSSSVYCMQADMQSLGPTTSMFVYASEAAPAPESPGLTVMENVSAMDVPNSDTPAEYRPRAPAGQSRAFVTLDGVMAAMALSW
jgi:hypothetical protein